MTTLPVIEYCLRSEEPALPATTSPACMPIPTLAGGIFPLSFSCLSRAMIAEKSNNDGEETEYPSQNRRAHFFTVKLLILFSQKIIDNTP